VFRMTSDSNMSRGEAARPRAAGFLQHVGRTLRESPCAADRSEQAEASGESETFSRKVARGPASHRANTVAKRTRTMGRTPHSELPTLVSSQPMNADGIKDLRDRARLSQEKLARVLGTSWITVSRWERGIGVPGGDAEVRLSRLSELLGRIGSAIPAERIYEFLDSPNSSFRGHRPMELLTSDYAFQDLLNFVESVKSGDMA
jgi:DNA-binding transcriptional regulator YiaG